MKVKLMVLMETLDHQRKNLVLIVLKQIQTFVWVSTIMLIIVSLLMENKSLKVLTFQLDFA